MPFSRVPSHRFETRCCPSSSRARSASRMSSGSRLVRRDALASETIMVMDVVEVEPRSGYRLWLRFQDGTEGEIDLGPQLTFQGVFAPLRDPAYFARVDL